MMSLMKPLLPPAVSMAKYLKVIDAGRYYTNSGPLLKLYEGRLSEIFKCHVVATSSGTSGLTAALMALDVRGKELLMPSWTFVATANAARMAGGVPSFVDVTEDNWQSVSDVGTAPFGLPTAYENEHLVIDAAAAFDVYVTGQSRVGATPVVISTHATKTFSTGEGGLVLTTDEKLANRIREIINHGMTLEREVSAPGINAKMSEYHAAVGLASLDMWFLTRMQWFETKRKYVEIFGALAHTTPLSSLSWVGSSFAVRLEHRVLDSFIRDFYAAGITTRRVWGRGVHRYEAYKDCSKMDLTVTEQLADSVLFLPYWIDAKEYEILKIKQVLDDALREPEREPNMWGV